MRGVKTKANKIWQSLVDVRKVYEALDWLKRNNPLYTHINLPFNVEDLFKDMDDCDIDISSANVNQENTCDVNIRSSESPVRRAMLTQKDIE